MRLECKNAEVTVIWDKMKNMEMVIKSKDGDVLFMQIQSPEATSTTIHKDANWDEVIGG